MRRVRTLRRHTLFALALLAALHVAGESPQRAPLPLRGTLQDKNFPLFSLIERDAGAAAAIGGDKVLRELFVAERDALRNALSTCGTDALCFVGPMRLTSEEISAAAAALRRVYRDDDRLRTLVDSELRRTGVYVRHHERSGEDLLAAAWTDAARAIDNIMDIYGEGKAPRSPAIDSVSFDVKSLAYGRIVQAAAGVLDEELRDEGSLFFQPSARFALRLLKANHRDEAARLEPLHTGENAEALRALASVRWDDFPYTTIIVPGSGPDRLTWSLSPQARLRCELAARRFKQRKAPLIIVSGGYVHPNQTPYCEAVEMKKALVTELGVPASAVIIEPHARHTTTNLRNAARLMYRYGIPFARKALVTTDAGHSSYIGGPAFAERCQKELGYQPAVVGSRLSPFDLEIMARVDSLHVDATDPLDP